MPPPYPATNIGTLFQRDDRTLEEKYGHMLAPYFKLVISDRDERVLFYAESSANEGNYDLNGLIVSDIEWAEDDCQASMMSMTVQNPDLRLHDSRMFAEGNSLDLWMGYDGFFPDYMGRAIIVEIAPEFPNGSIPTIRITAYDISHFMMEEGKAEIQAEGTQWWERNRVNQTPANQSSTQTTLTNTRDTQSQAQAARNEARSSGATPGQVASIPQQSIDESGRSANPGNTEIRGFTTSSGRRTNTPQNRTRLRQARSPRRRRKQGKVWRNLRDDEIVSAIFESYGIVPYTEALNQRARSRTEQRTVQHQGEIRLNNILDTVEQARERQRQEGSPGNTQPVSVDTHGPRLRPSLRQRAIRAERINDTTVNVTVEVGGRRVVQKAGTSDWEFIKKLAKNHGYIMFVFYYFGTGDWIGYWGSPHNVPQHVVYQFHYNNGDGTTIQSFRPKLSTRGQKTEIDLMYTDPVTRRQQKLRVAMENVSSYTSEFRGPDATALMTETLGSGPEVLLSINGQRVAVQANRRFTSMDDACRWLMAFWYQHAPEFCEAEGEFIAGLPEIHCRHKHVMNGFSRYDGNYFLTQVSHKMSPGSVYTTSFSGYRVVDMLWSPPDQETEALTVESEEMGQLTPAAQDIVNEWERAGGE